MTQVHVDQITASPLGGIDVVVAHLDHRPDGEWRDMFERIVHPAFYGMHPHLDGDEIVVRSRHASGLTGSFVIEQAVVTVNAFIDEDEPAAPVLPALSATSIVAELFARRGSGPSLG